MLNASRFVVQFALPHDARIIFLLVDVARRQIERRQMRGKQGNVRAVNLRDAVLVRRAGIHVRLAMIGANQKAARTARRV